jgi:DNA-binding NarL/FixJ family response regulator
VPRLPKAQRTERIASAFELRKTGMSLREIAQRLSVSHETIRKDINEIAKQYFEEARESHREIVAMDLLRLDEMTFGVWDKARSGDTKAIEAVLKIMERRAKMLGMDAQQTTKSVQLNVTPEQISEMTDDELQQLIQQFQ